MLTGPSGGSHRPLGGRVGAPPASPAKTSRPGRPKGPSPCRHRFTRRSG